ncbi:MAG: cell division protein FtsZ [Bacteroidales bacterium]|nr:cell division protein FtsZ [Bacteroidales bacterium]
MSDIFEITPAAQQQGSYIKVIGVGGAGTNAVNHMYNKGITGVDFIVCNTDKQSLDSSPVEVKVKLGDKDLGAGNDPNVGQQAAIAASDRIKAVLDNNTHMLFIAAGMGGGTGTGASPEIAKIAKEIEIDGGNDEILVVAVVTIPFSFEGRKRREQAKVGIENLKEVVDSIIVVNTDKLKGRGNMLLTNAFALADDVLLTAAKGIAEIMTANAYIHVDFRDVQSVMRNSGVALMGSGVGEGEDRAYEAIKAATESDLLNDNDLKDTKNILLYVSFSSKEDYQLQMDELETITSYIDELTSPDVDKIWGYGYDDSLDGKIAITLVATGFKDKEIYHDPQRYMSDNIERRQNKDLEVKVLPVEQPQNNPQPTKADNQPKAETTPFVQPQVQQKPINLNPQPVTPLFEDFKMVQKEEKSQAQVLVEPKKEVKAEPEIIKIQFGEPIRQESEIKSEPIKENTVSERKEDILAAFARTEEKTQSIEIPETEETVAFEKPTMASLFAPSENKEMDSIFQSPKSEEKSVSAPTLKDTIGGITINTEANKGTFSLKEATESRKDRIRRINELLKAGKADFIESLRPTVDDIDEKLSMVSNPETRMGVSKEGTVTIMESPVIGSGVD